MFDGNAAVVAGILRSIGKQVCTLPDPAHIGLIGLFKSLSVPCLTLAHITYSVRSIVWNRYSYSPCLPGIPIGMFLSFNWKMGLHGLWYGLTLSLVYCSVMGTIVCLRTNWEREVIKVAERLKKEDKTRQEEQQEDEERALLLSQ